MPRSLADPAPARADGLPDPQVIGAGLRETPQSAWNFRLRSTLRESKRQLGARVLANHVETRVQRGAARQDAQEQLPPGF
eukprot:8101162-Pyramimonas_sp.AAC.1